MITAERVRYNTLCEVFPTNIQGTIKSMESLIAVSGLAKAFGLFPALRGVDFTVEKGIQVALLGPNGSGKTTLLRLLCALSRPTAGTISVGGWALPGEAAAVRAQLGVVMHLPLLYDDLTAEENLRFFARLYNLDKPNAWIAACLARVGLAKQAHELVRTFSRGMQQRLSLARAAIHNPAVLLLDEPYTGLDVNGTEMLDGLLDEWKSAGRTVIISTHDLQRATASDQVLILHRGRLVANQSLSQLSDLSALFARVTPQ